MDLALKGKAVLITGGSRGIGRQIALDFAAEGADVAICGRDAEQLKKTGAELRALGVKVHTTVADLFHAADCARAVEESAAALGRLDILVNNASTNVAGTLMTLTDEKLMERVYGKTLASMRVARAAVPHLRRAGGGSIICIGGTSARAPKKRNLPAGLGNSALANFVKHLSNEVGPDHIVVNIVHPSFCKTDRYPQRLATRAKQRGISLAEAEAEFIAGFPIGRLVEPADVSPVVLFLASRHATAITGQAIAVDGGMTQTINY